ncbi:MAG: tryptophan-rich sensory protein [Candidatus Dojkabacteria bacterium]|nr:tryptophan-rich sensory protein [Candidatus Dojkabacteria bacterium]
MKRKTKTKDKKSLILKIATAASVLVMFVVNTLANTIPINGMTTGAVSDSIKIFFVPAAYVFSIWGLIYLGIVLYLFLMFKKYENFDKKISLWVIIGSLANAGWIFLWHYELIYSSVILMLVLLGSLIAIHLEMNKEKVSIWKRLPFNIYLGWISVATVANIAGALYLANWNGFGISGEIWSAIMIIIATTLGLIAAIKKNYAYTLVILWALIGILVRFSGVSDIVAVTSLITVILISVFFGIKLYIPNKDEKRRRK